MLLSPRLGKFKRVREFLWNSRCPLCGDFQKNKNKARLYFYQKKNGLYVKCHNCGAGMSVGNFIKIIDPHLHNQYIMEQYSEGKTHPPTYQEKTFKFAPPKFKPKKTEIELPSISDLDPNHYAREYISNRKIPVEFYNDIYYCEDFREWVNTISEEKYDSLYKNDKRIVIPFFDENRILIAAQGRSLDNSELRYITVKTKIDNSKIFGLDRWDSKKTTYIVEGPFDSLFLPNSLACAGSDLVTNIDKENSIIIYDNEPRNREMTKKMHSIIDKGLKVCIWPDTCQQKDINDMILSGISKDNVLNIINNNAFSGLNAQARMSLWKKHN